MSLMADLLAKVGRPAPKRDVPPLLKEAVWQSAKDARVKRRLLISALVAVVIIAGGAAALVFMDSLHPPGRLTPMAVPATSSPVQQSPSVPVQRTEEPVSPVVPEKAGTVSAAALAPGAEKTLDAAMPNKGASGKKALPKFLTSSRTSEKKKRPEMKHDAGPAAPRMKVDEAVAQDRDLYLHTARTYEEQGLFQKALTDYEKALSIDPGNHVVMSNMAGAFLRLGNHRQAVRYAGQALLKKANYVPALVNLGIAYSQTGQEDIGRKHLEHALSLEPNNRLALLNTGLLLEKRSAFADAGKCYAKLSAAGESQGYLGLARIAEKEARIPDAIYYYQTTLSVEKMDSPLWKAANERLWQLAR